MCRHTALWVVLGLALAGCATSPIPEGYNGPTATIRDSATSESASRAAFFFVSEIDGKRIETSLARSRSANYGRGASLAPVIIERKIPAKPLIVKLEGQTAYGAPIQALVMASRMYSVTELVEFEPRPEQRYVVRGVLTEGKQSVWLEEEESRERVGKKVDSQ